MKVVSYLSSVPSRNNKPQKEELLKRYIQGVNAAGDTGILHIGSTLVDADVAVVQGWVYDKKTSTHLRLRDNIINRQTSLNKHTL